MQTTFTVEQLADPSIRIANGELRACVHCGFCTATCPTYVLLGDEADSPRGRIYLIKDMLENDKPASPEVVRHIDRCLSCLSCMTTCPSGVNYMHLVDIARARIEETYVRPMAERMVRRMLAVILPYPGRFRLALIGALLARPFRRLVPGFFGAILDLAPSKLAGPSSVDRPQVFPAQGTRKRRIALLTGCAQQVLRPAINEATIRLLTRLGCEVVVPHGLGCCGALVHHLGLEQDGRAAARAAIIAIEAAEAEGGVFDAFVINASGCGTMIKDYGHLLANDPDWCERAARISKLARDISEVIDPGDLAPIPGGKEKIVAYHSACSMQHGQKLHDEPVRLLAAAGYSVRTPAEGHLCCGSAGTYNILQPAIAGRLRARKAANLNATDAAIVATGNIGCLTQLGGITNAPVVHIVELLDWACGGPRPSELAAFD
jgi:glycolate oxidase iron-sulfur subunit